MTFPVSPTNGQTTVVNNITYQYTSASNSWRRVVSNIVTATNIFGGAANQIVYQTGVGQTGFISAPTVANSHLEWTGSAFRYTTTGTFTDVIVHSDLNFTAANANLRYGATKTGWFQFAMQNASTATTSTTDIVAFTNNGNDDGGYIDFGISSSNYNDPTYNLSGGGDGYLYVVGTGTSVGKLVISTYQPQDIIFSTGGGATQHELGRWKHATGLQVTTSTTATSTTTGALQVTGGVGIRGSVYVGGTVFGLLDRVSNRITVGTTAPVSPAVNDVWIDTN